MNEAMRMLYRGGYWLPSSDSCAIARCGLLHLRAYRRCADLSFAWAAVPNSLQSSHASSYVSIPWTAWPELGVHGISVGRFVSTGWNVCGDNLTVQQEGVSKEYYRSYSWPLLSSSQKAYGQRVKKGLVKRWCENLAENPEWCENSTVDPETGEKLQKKIFFEVGVGIPLLLA